MRATPPTSSFRSPSLESSHTDEAAIVYVLASLGEIAGCFFWAWLRLGKSPLWLVPGMASLESFAYLLTRLDSSAAGRAYAAYGSVYIVSSICWLWVVEGARPDLWDTLGAGWPS